MKWSTCPFITFIAQSAAQPSKSLSRLRLEIPTSNRKGDRHSRNCLSTTFARVSGSDGQTPVAQW